jgi:Na+/phosphate symporter
MKIELKLTADEINYLERQTLLVQSIDTNQLTKDKKAAYTIMLDVSDKLMAKAKQLNRKTDLFDQKKKHKITLKWHEAETLEQYIDVFSICQDDPYKANLARKVIIQLNQKLA